MAALGAVAPGAFASHGLETLTGSNFEIDTDANLKLDHTGGQSADWATVADTPKADSPSGSGDESFGNGSKEDTAVPTVVDGSIPPNKSDLKSFGIWQEGSTSNGFLNLYWTRVQDPQGTTNMDFEFNQLKADPDVGNGVTPLRTAGDLLITYDLAKGGTHPLLSLREWSGTAWGAATDLTASNKAAGSINTASIPAGESDGVGPLDPRTFGEAQIDLGAIFTDNSVCQSFGSAYLKSRSSDSFTAALKDFVPPVAINISNCGSIKIIKKDDANNALAGAVFTLYKDNTPTGTSKGAEDTTTGKTCTTAIVSGVASCTITNVPQGAYWVVETTTPTGYDTAADQNVTVTADNTVELTFTNPRQRGAITVHKTRKHAASGSTPIAQQGVTFTVKKGTTTLATGLTDANGDVCFDNLLFDTYTLHETVPSGYHGEADKSVTVDNKASCTVPTGQTSAGETVNFVNTPLTNLTVSVQSQITGGTNSKITCTGLTPTPADGTPNAFDDTSETVNDLEPGTYTCTVVIDP